MYNKYTFLKSLFSLYFLLFLTLHITQKSWVKELFLWSSQSVICYKFQKVWHSKERIQRILCNHLDIANGRPSWVMSFSSANIDIESFACNDLWKVSMFLIIKCLTHLFKHALLPMCITRGYICMDHSASSSTIRSDQKCSGNSLRLGTVRLAVGNMIFISAAVMDIFA